MTQPLDPFSEVVDEQRKWKPDWYTWTLQVGEALGIDTGDLTLRDSDDTHDLTIDLGSNLTADRTLTLVTGDADRTLTLTGNATISGTHSGTSSGNNTGDQTITLTGDVTGSGTGSFAATIANNAVSNAKLRDSTALTVIGRSVNSSGDPADIAAVAASGAVLRESGSTLGFGTVTAVGIASDAVTTVKILDDNVTFDKIENVVTNTILGRVTAATGNIEELTGTQATTLIDIFTTALKGLAPASGGGTTNFLRSDATWAVPTAAPTGWVLLQTQTAAASSEIDFVNGVGGAILDDTYDLYMVAVTNLKPTTDDVEFYLRIGTGGGPTYQSGASDYGWRNQLNDIINGEALIGDTADSEIEVGAGQVATQGLGNAAGEHLTCMIYFANPEVTDAHTFWWEGTYIRASGEGVRFYGVGRYNSTTAVTAIRFLMSGGTTIASGRLSLYGLVKS